jgi:S-adenosylmethionine decarboxylase
MAGAKESPEPAVSGLEWVVEAHGCNPGALTDLRKLEDFFRTVIRELALHPLQKTVWHQFPRTGGITGVCLLSESHVACHTFPEYASLCLNVFCCRPRPDADFKAWLRDEFGATQVHVRRIERSYRP